MITRTLWYKAWLDTRWRFAIGLTALSCMALLVVMTSSRLIGLPPDRWRASIALARVLDSAWFGQALPQLWCLFAILLGSGGLLSQAARGGAMFMLSLPATRTQLVVTRTTLVVLELYLLALLPSLTITLWAPLVGASYASIDVLVAAFCLVVGGTIFFAVPFFLSSLVEQPWVPVAVMLSTALVISVVRQLDPDLGRFTLAPVLTAREYFLNGGSLPWTGLVASAALSMALIALAVRNVARRDF